MTGRTRLFERAVSDHALTSRTQLLLVAIGARDAVMSSLKGEARGLVVENGIGESFGFVALIAGPIGELAPVGILVGMAIDTTPRPAGLFEKSMFEGVHPEGGSTMATVTTVRPESPFVWIVWLVAGQTRARIFEPEHETHPVPFPDLMACRAGCYLMGSCE